MAAAEPSRSCSRACARSVATSVAAGLVVASGGNLSARLPGADEFWVTAAGTWLDRLAPADFVERHDWRRRRGRWRQYRGEY